MMKTIIKVQDNKVLIGNFSFALEKKLVKKLERGVKGVTQKNPEEDSLFINEGRERKGKTNSSICETAYVKGRTGRDIHLFFNLKPLMEFAQKNKDKIIIWDEPSLDSLSNDQITNLNKDMQRLFMTVGKKRHFFIINYTKFWKFPEYIVVERANGMIHMLENKKIGRFYYIRHKKMEKLWKEKKSRQKKEYKKCSSFGGNMPNIMEKYFDKLDICVNGKPHATYQDYQDEKDKAILSIGNQEKKSRREIIAEIKLAKLRKRIANAVKDKLLPVTQVRISQIVGAHPKELRIWRTLPIPSE